MKNFQQSVTPESVISGTTSAMQEEEDRTTPTSVGTGTISGTVADDLESEISGGFEKDLKNYVSIEHSSSLSFEISLLKR